MRYSIIAGLSALIMMIVSFNINVNASEKYDTTDIRIGTTGYVISAPSDYYSADVTEKERRDDMIAYYKSDKHLMDFDIYQYEKGDKTLYEYTEIESKEYGAKEFDEIKINGIDFTLYYSDEKYNEIEYRVANYIFEVDEDFGEISFWLDGDDAEELTEQIMSSLKFVGDSYDMTGMIIEKLPEDYYYNHYNVCGDDDETYICNYNGDDELDPGTIVNMYKIAEDGGYTIEVAKKADSKKASNAIFTDVNGIEVTDIKIVLVGETTYNVQIVFYNPTDKDQSFDLTKIRVENQDEEEIKVFSANVNPELILANQSYKQKAYTILDPENIKLGDEVSFYYDQQLINKAKIEAF